MLSCMVVERTPICSWMRLNMGRTLPPKRTVATTNTDMGTRARRASQAFSRSMAPMTPTNRSRVAVRSMRPMPMKRSVSAMSLVARLIRSPVWAWSWKAKGRRCRLR